MVKLINGDCTKEYLKIPSKSIDMAFCDLPYGVTANKWDSVIPFDTLWEMMDYCVKDNGVMVFTATQPFSSYLLLSKEEWFRHEWIWVKDRGSNFANTAREPFKEHEHILIFSKVNGWTYNKQMQERKGGGKDRVKYDFVSPTRSTNYGKFTGGSGSKGKNLRVPSSVQQFKTERGLHPTQKPICLMEYMIKTYTNPEERVLDICMGSGGTMVACLNTDRNGIGIEINEEYFSIAKDRIENHQSQVSFL